MLCQVLTPKTAYTDTMECKRQTEKLRDRNEEEKLQLEGGGAQTKGHYLINLTTAVWNAQSDSLPLMLRAGVIYHGERRLTLSPHH